MKINELQLLSPDLAATEAFYNKLLGLAIHDKDTRQITFRLGDTLIGFSQADDAKPVYHMAFDIPHNQLEDAYDWLKEKTAILPVTADSVFSEFERWNARSLYFYDHQGNILELICRFDLDNAATAPFGASSFLHVSEIGIVCRDVPEMVKQIHNKYRLDLYPKQPPADNFTVMGDEEGLFIIVSEHRKWFPTEVEAGIYPVKIVFTAGADKEEILWIE